MNRPPRLLVLALGILVLSGILLGLQHWTGSEGGRLGLHLASLEAPLAEGASRWSDRVRDLGRLGELSDQNGALQAEVARLQVDQERLRVVQAENDRLRALLGLKASSFPTGIAARVSARDPNLWYSQILLDRGSRDGVRPNTVVVAPDGLVGKVTSVGPHGSWVRLLLDARTAVPAMLAGTGALGVVYGEDGFTCVMKFIDHDVRIQEGELVLTSGLGDLYPAGVPLGRVGRQYGRTEALFQSVQVHPSVDFGALREALIVEKRSGG